MMEGLYRQFIKCEANAKYNNAQNYIHDRSQPLHFGEVFLRHDYNIVRPEINAPWTTSTPTYTQV